MYAFLQSGGLGVPGLRCLIVSIYIGTTPSVVRGSIEHAVVLIEYPEWIATTVGAYSIGRHSDRVRGAGRDVIDVITAGGLPIVDLTVVGGELAFHACTDGDNIHYEPIGQFGSRR